MSAPMLPPAPALLSTMNGLAEGLAELGRERAREDVGGAAGRERHDDAHRLGRPARPGRAATAAAATRRAPRTTSERRRSDMGGDLAPGRGRSLPVSRRALGGRPRGACPRRAEDATRNKEGGAGHQAGAALEQPRLPAPPGRRPVGERAVRPAPGASEWGHWLASGAASENCASAATSRRPEQRQLLRRVRRARQHARPLRRPRRSGAGAVRRKRAAPISGAATKAEVSMAVDVRRGSGRQCRRARRGATASRRRARRRVASDRRARARRSRAPSRRAAARRRSPRRSSDDAPPWQRGPAGRRSGADDGANGAKTDIERLSRPRREGNISLQDSRVREEERNVRASAARVIDATRRRATRAPAAARVDKPAPARPARRTRKQVLRGASSSS